MLRKHVYIFGRVQGVYFREHTRIMAERLKIRGWVRNLPDGRVEAVFEGANPDIDKMIDWCRTGSLPARVDNLEIIDETFRDEFPKFNITG